MKKINLMIPTVMRTAPTTPLFWEVVGYVVFATIILMVRYFGSN